MSITAQLGLNVETGAAAAPTVSVTPIFSADTHIAWSACCPHCNMVWESLDTYTDVHIVECDMCEKEYRLSYSKYETDY